MLLLSLLFLELIVSMCALRFSVISEGGKSLQLSAARHANIFHVPYSAVLHNSQLFLKASSTAFLHSHLHSSLTPLCHYRTFHWSKLHCSSVSSSSASSSPSSSSSTENNEPETSSNTNNSSPSSSFSSSSPISSSSSSGFFSSFSEELKHARDHYNKYNVPTITRTARVRPVISRTYADMRDDVRGKKVSIVKTDASGNMTLEESGDTYTGNNNLDILFTFRNVLPM